MASYPQKVQVEYNGRKMYLPVSEGLLSLKGLQKFYPLASGLTYNQEGETVAVNFINDEQMEIDSKIDLYNIYIPEGTVPNNLCDAKRRRLDQMLKDIGVVKKAKVTKKDDSDAKENPVDVSFEAKTRVLNISWKHRSDRTGKFRSLSSIGYKMKINLSMNEDYTVEELKEKLITAYVKPSMQYFFKCSRIHLGYGKDNIIYDFVNAKGKCCIFWEFSKTIRDKAHRLNILLLTTLDDDNDPVEDISKDEKLSKNLPSTESVLKWSPLDCGKPFSMVGFEHSEKEILSRKENISISSNDSIDKNSKGRLNVSPLLPKTTNDQSSTNVEIQLKYSSIVNETKSQYDSSIMSIETCKKSNISNISNYPSCTSLLKKQNKRSEECYVISPSKSASAKVDGSLSLLNGNKDYRKSLNSVSPMKDFLKPSSIPSVIKKKVALLDLQFPQIEEKDIDFTNEMLGRGAQGVVMKATWAGTLVAVKSIQCTRHEKLTLREIKMLEKIRHINFINVMALSLSQTQFHIIMEFFEGKSLDDILFNGANEGDYFLNEKKKNSIGLQLCTAIHFLHAQKYPILHRDIKPSNVMINKHCMVKVCDLGISKSNDLNTHLLTSLDGIVGGTVLYMAPEIFISQCEPTTTSDVWAVGCTLIELYKEDHVWNINAFNAYSQLEKLLNDKTVPDVNNVPYFLKEILKKSFSYDPLQRATMHQILKVYIRHKQLVNTDFFQD